MDLQKEIRDLRARVEKLELAISSGGASKVAKAAKAAGFKGATGGVRLLNSEGYFRTRRLFTAVVAELKAQGYVYSKQAFQNALTRLSRPGGPLVTIREGKNKVYAERK